MTACPAMMNAARQDALYVYCVARPPSGNAGVSPVAATGETPVLPERQDACRLGPIGLDGRDVYSVASGGLLAIVHRCQDQPYQSQDAQVVKGWAVAHQNVICAATEALGTVLPMAFDMIVRGKPRAPETGEVLAHDAKVASPPCRAVDALKAWLDEKQDRFVRLLDKLAGQAEFGVQVFWDRAAVAAWLIENDDQLCRIQDEARDKPKGLAYLLGQKLAKAVRAAMERHADACAQDLYARIRACVTDIRVDKLKLVAGDRQMLLNLSCLMPTGSGQLGRVLDEIQSRPGMRVRFTGPWPPYSFVGG